MVLPLRPAERHWYVIWCLSQETNSSHTCYCWLWWRCQYNASPSIHSHHVWLLLAHRLIFDPGQRAGILEEITLLNGWEIPMSQISHSGFSPIYIFLPVLDSLVDQLLLAINWPKTKIFEQQLVVSCQRNIGRFIARQLMMLWVAMAMFCLNPPPLVLGRWRITVLRWQEVIAIVTGRREVIGFWRQNLLQEIRLAFNLGLFGWVWEVNKHKC